MANTSVIVIPEGKICDYVDGKFRNDTPEEYVRQTIEKRLVNEHKYLPKQIRIEYTLQLGSRKPRADIVIFDKDCGEQTQENIKIIIECKKEAVEARNAKDGVEQLKSYMSACPNCEWGMWTNGRQKEVYHKYECSRAHGKTKTAITVKTTGVSVFCFEQDGYDIDVLRQQSGFIGLTQRQKEQCEECYRELTPYRITSVLESGQATKQIGAYNFVNDAEKISEAIVIILYMLRCCLAHGDISPDESANEVYKYAYEVLCAPLRKLK